MFNKLLLPQEPQSFYRHEAYKYIQSKEMVEMILGNTRPGQTSSIESITKAVFETAMIAERRKLPHHIQIRASQGERSADLTPDMSIDCREDLGRFGLAFMLLTCLGPFYLDVFDMTNTKCSAVSPLE